MDEIIIEVTKEGEELEALTIEYLYKIIDGSRTRLRTVNSLLMTVSGFILSTSFVILFFILQNEKLKVPKTVIYLLFLTIGNLIVSILFNIFSALLYQPTSPINKADFIDTIASIYHKEHRRAYIAVIFLIISILLFTISLLILAITTL